MARGKNEGLLGGGVKNSIKSRIRSRVSQITGLPEESVIVSRRGLEVGLRQDYRGSGMTTEEALRDGHRRLDGLIDGMSANGTPMPEQTREMLEDSFQMSMICDGGCRSVLTVKQGPDENGFYGASGWKHQDGWDFCPDCQANGQMALALDKLRS